MAMSLAPDNLRYERKFLVSTHSLESLLAMVRRHPALFHEVYPARFINNVYLDSPGLTAYHDHVHGVADRGKVRIRWYGPFSGLIQRPILERKIKRGLVSYKLSDALPPLPVNGRVDRQALAAALDQASLPAGLRLALRHLEPSSLNRYRRRYYLSADRRFRLTIDSDLRFASPRGPAIWTDPRAHETPTLILEIKYAAAHAVQAQAVTNVLPCRLGRCSKYVLGIEALAAA